MYRILFLFGILIMLLIGAGGALCQEPDSPTWRELSGDVRESRFIKTKRIFDKLIRAIGSDKNPPDLRILSDGDTVDSECCKMQIAWISCENSPTIFVEDTLIKLAENHSGNNPVFFEKSMAFILGHELAHHYFDHLFLSRAERNTRHKWIYFHDYRKNNILPDSADYYIEREADYYSSFYCYSAGLDIRDVYKPFVNLMYSEGGFDLDDEELQSYGYLPLEKRINVADTVLEWLNTLIPVFETGKYCIMIKEYDAAAECFMFVNKFFPSAENLNNIGVTFVLKALELDTIKFKFPIQIDLKTKIKDLISKGEKEDIKKYLDSARKMFEKAIAIDKHYLPAKINLAAVYCLQSRYSKSVQYINTLLDSQIYLSGYYRSNAHIIKGIACAKMNRTEDARMEFENALQHQDADTATISMNMKLLKPKKEVRSSSKLISGKNNDKVEKMKKKSAWQFRNRLKRSRTKVELKIPMGDITGLTHGVVEKCRVFCLNGTGSVFVVADENSGVETDSGLNFDMNKADILKSYGYPDYEYKTFSGEFFIYDGKRTILFFSDNHKLTEIIIYKK